VARRQDITRLRVIGRNPTPLGVRCPVTTEPVPIGALGCALQIDMLIAAWLLALASTTGCAGLPLVEAYALVDAAIRWQEHEAAGRISPAAADRSCRPLIARAVRYLAETDWEQCA
jgi:hypothetical protein